MAQNEIQTLTLYGSPTGGTCDITFDGQTASGVAYNASAASVQSALEALSNIGAGNVSCSGGPWPGSTITCEFVNSLASTSLLQMDIDPSGLTGSSITASIAETTAGGPDLDTGLIAYWKCDEASGDLLDAEGSYDLSETGSISSATGLQLLSRYEPVLTAKYFIGAGVTYSILYNPNRTRTFGLWIYPTDLSDRAIIQAYYNSTTYMLLSLSSSKIQFKILDYIGTLRTVTADTFGTLSVNNWYYISCSVDVDGTPGEISVGVNGQTDSANYGQFWPAGSGNFRINPYKVRIDEVAAWDGRVLSSSELTQMYNSGTGRTHPLPSGNDEVQTLSVTGSPSAGSLTLGYLGEYAVINYDDTSGEVDTALEGISGIGSGNITTTGGPLPGSSVAVTFTNDLSETNIDLLELNYDLLLCKVVTTQEGAPTPSQSSAAWSSSTLTPHITGGSAAWSSGDVTASGNVDQATAEWSGSDLQATGIVNSSLPTATWSADIVSSAVLTGASAAWSSGTVVLPGVFSAPAQANWKTLQFAVLPDYPVMAYWKTKSVTSDHNPLNVPTATWSSGTAQPAPALTGTPSAAWSTTEATLELTSVPVTAAWSTGSSVLSPALTQPSVTWTSREIIVPLFADSAYIGMVTHRIIDSSLLVLTFTDGTITQPVGSNGTITSPGGFSGTLTSPEGVSGTFA